MLVHYQWSPSRNQEFVGPCSNLTRHKIDLTWQLWIVNHWGFQNFWKLMYFPSVKKSYFYYDYRSKTNSSFCHHSINFIKRIEKGQIFVHFIHQSCKSKSDCHPHKTLFDIFLIETSRYILFSSLKYFNSLYIGKKWENSTVNCYHVLFN